jgi:hypothetical protein
VPRALKIAPTEPLHIPLSPRPLPAASARVAPCRRRSRRVELHRSLESSRLSIPGARGHHQKLQDMKPQLRGWFPLPEVHRSTTIREDPSCQPSSCSSAAPHNSSSRGENEAVRHPQELRVDGLRPGSSSAPRRSTLTSSPVRRPSRPPPRFASDSDRLPPSPPTVSTPLSPPRPSLSVFLPSRAPHGTNRRQGQRPGVPCPCVRGWFRAFVGKEEDKMVVLRLDP